MVKYKYIGSIKRDDLYNHTDEALLALEEIIDIARMHGKVDDTAKDKQPSDYDADCCDEFNEYFLGWCDNENNERVYDLFKIVVTDRNGKEINVGDSVRWYDPDESARDLSRVYEVWDVRGEIVMIGDSFSEAEVFPHELEVIQD